jgi:hypothetical protein
VSEYDYKYIVVILGYINGLVVEWHTQQTYVKLSAYKETCNVEPFKVGETLTSKDKITPSQA